MTDPSPDRLEHAPGAGWDRAREVLGWPELPDDPEAEARFEEENQRAQEAAREFYGRTDAA
jgi:hypothetical protein